MTNPTYLELSHGRVFYEQCGPEDGPPVVLVHGFAVPSYTWDPTVPILVDAGFRVIRFDVYGRGHSAKPKMKYTVDLYMEQIHELTERLALKTPMHIGGVSMGGLFSAMYTTCHPERVDKVVLISPAGFPQFHPLRAVSQVPGLNQLVLHTLAKPALKRVLRKNFYNPDLPRYQEFYKKFDQQTQDPGFLPAVLSMFQNLPLFDAEHVYQTLGQQNNEVLAIWGKQDQIVPFTNMERLQAFVPKLQSLPVDQAGHTAHYEHPDIVNPILIDFLKA